MGRLATIHGSVSASSMRAYQNPSAGRQTEIFQRPR